MKTRHHCLDELSTSSAPVRLWQQPKRESGRDRSILVKLSQKVAITSRNFKMALGFLSIFGFHWPRSQAHYIISSLVHRLIISSPAHSLTTMWFAFAWLNMGLKLRAFDAVYIAWAKQSQDQNETSSLMIVAALGLCSQPHASQSYLKTWAVLTATRFAILP